MHLVPSVPVPTRYAGVVRQRPSHARLLRVSHVVTVLLVALFAFFLTVVAAFAAYGLTHADRAYAGVSIGGVDVSGMSRDEVTQVVADQYAGFASTSITLTAGDARFDQRVADLGIAVDTEATVDRAMAQGRHGSLWDRSIQWSRSLLHGTDLDPVIVVDSRTFHAALVALAPDVIYAPANARVDVLPGGSAELVDDVPGRSIDVTGTREAVLRHLTTGSGTTVPLALVSIPAPVTTVDVQGGLPRAERALAGSLFVESPDGRWGLTPSALSEMVWVDDAGELQVRQDEVETWVAGIAAQVDHPAVDAAIEVDTDGAFVVQPHVTAATVDQAGTVDRVIEAIRSGAEAVDLVVEREEPAILTNDADTWAARAEEMIGNGLALRWSGGSSQLGRADLLAALVITPQPESDEKFALSFDPAVMAERLAPLQKDLHLDVQQAQFRLVDGAIRFHAEARQGREMDMDASVESVLAALANGEPEVPITVNVIEPTYTSASRDDIALPDVLGTSSTWYGNSSAPRRHNVERAVELENGWLIAPGEIFSFAQFSGLITEDNGFVTGFGIVADPAGGVTTAPVIGGGICQVSTTIFQAAFWAGLEIVERWAHPYWLESYGQAPYGMRGLDAMVNIEPDWALDLKFRNTTGDWIAVVLDADGENVYVDIRGIDQGWQVDVPDPSITNIVKPDDVMMYTNSPELPKGGNSRSSGRRRALPPPLPGPCGTPTARSSTSMSRRAPTPHRATSPCGGREAKGRTPSHRRPDRSRPSSRLDRTRPGARRAGTSPCAGAGGGRRSGAIDPCTTAGR